MSQLAAVIDSSPAERIVVIGDTNTRASEITNIKDSGLEVPDLPGLRGIASETDLMLIVLVSKHRLRDASLIRMSRLEI